MSIVPTGPSFDAHGPRAAARPADDERAPDISFEWLIHPDIGAIGAHPGDIRGAQGRVTVFNENGFFPLQGRDTGKGTAATATDASLNAERAWLRPALAASPFQSLAPSLKPVDAGRISPWGDSNEPNVGTNRRGSPSLSNGGDTAPVTPTVAKSQLTDHTVGAIFGRSSQATTRREPLSAAPLPRTARPSRAASPQRIDLKLLTDQAGISVIADAPLLTAEERDQLERSIAEHLARHGLTIARIAIRMPKE